MKMRLIDAEELRAVVIGAGKYFKCLERTEESNALRNLITWVVGKIDDAPAIEAAPVIRGKWKGYVCSVCGLSSAYGSESYCPECGAKMDEMDGGEKQ